MLAFSPNSQVLITEMLAWGIILHGQLVQEPYVEVHAEHLKLALLSCEGPGKDFLARLGITMTTESRQGSLLCFQAGKKLDQLPAAREAARQSEMSLAFSDVPLCDVMQEAERMESAMVEPIHHILVLARMRSIPVSYDFLCSVLDSSGAVKSPEILGQDLARMEKNLADLQDRQSRWASVVAAMRESLASNQATLSSIEKELASLARCIEWMQGLQQASTPIA